MRLALACVLLLGCSSGSAGAGPVDGGGGDASVDGSLDGSGADAAKGDAGEGGPDAGGPVITGLTITVNPNSVLSATLTFTTDRPCVGSAQLVNQGASANTVTPPAEPAPVTSHTLRLLGMRAQSTFDVAVKAVDTAGLTSTATTTYTTGALPADVPPLTIVTNDPTQTQPGFMLLDVQEFTGTPVASPDGTAGSYVLGLDADLQVVWYYRGVVSDPEKLPNGDLVFLDGAGGWAEIDMMGTVVQSHAPSELRVSSLTHAITPEPSGRLLSLSTEQRFVNGFPAPDGGTQPLSIVGNQVVEMSADGGGVTVHGDPFDWWNPVATRAASGNVGHLNDFYSHYWDYLYPDAAPTEDWVHGNAVAIDPTDGLIVGSSRTLSWIFKTGFDGKLVWKLGPGGDFALSDAGLGQGEGFNNTQHAAYVTPGGTIMCFDDGADRGVTPFYSRALEMSLDTTKKVATVVWQYEDGFYSQIFGSSYLLTGGTVLVDDGCELSEPSITNGDPNNLKWARIMEVTHTNPPVKLAEVDIKVPLGGFAPDPQYSGFGVYRAIKVASLY